MKTLIAANWKMHGQLAWTEKPAQFRALFPANANANSNDRVDILICPPAHMLQIMVAACAGLDISIGAQNCHDQTSGAYTGEMSAQMVAETGANHVILGHSERRAMFGDRDEVVAAKTSATLKAGLVPIVCVGENRGEREAGQAEEVVGAQLAASIPQHADGVSLVIAYEPVWAIGSGLVPTLEDIAIMHDHIRGCLITRFGAPVADNIQILYGGSLKPGNAKEILALKDVGGGLIGGAGLEMDSLAAIAMAAP
ncbi:MAG: triose-phosphate isomerase [Robiginitomaculum sp.]|nr:MAG: triose-phosphate isomerase [Robiginitomaculum sp.]